MMGTPQKTILPIFIAPPQAVQHPASPPRPISKGHIGLQTKCPLYPRKRTFRLRPPMIVVPGLCEIITTPRPRRIGQRHNRRRYSCATAYPSSVQRPRVSHCRPGSLMPASFADPVPRNWYTAKSPSRQSQCPVPIETAASPNRLTAIKGILGFYLPGPTAAAAAWPVSLMMCMPVPARSAV
jgi:hypothetical protein